MRAARRPLPMLFAALLATTREARAQDRDPIPPPSPRWAVGFNPLAMAIGRYGGDLQHLVSPGLALLVNVHGDLVSHDWPAMQYGGASPVWGFGGEVGCRWFTARRRMQGFFFGASLVGGWYSVEYYGRRFGLPGVGPAVDMGGQVELGSGLFVAFGGGMQYLLTTRYPADIASGVSWVMGAGINPRLLLTFGALLR